MYADLRIMMANRKRLIREITQIKNRFARWFAIYFPEYKEVFGDYEAQSSMLLLKVACTPQAIVELGAEKINQMTPALVRAARTAVKCGPGHFGALFLPDLEAPQHPDPLPFQFLHIIFHLFHLLSGDLGLRSFMGSVADKPGLERVHRDQDPRPDLQDRKSRLLDKLVCLRQADSELSRKLLYA